jgi:uncharacterized membrane protein SpoIIM required for sporulation
MLIDLKQFVNQERSFWSELEAVLDRLAKNPSQRLSLDQVKQFHYLYARTSSDLARLAADAADPNIRRYLESLISRAYAEIHESREKPHRMAPLRWFFTVFPRTFRRHLQAFWISLAAMLLGCLFGALALLIDPGAKEVIMPFAHLQGDPSERVAREESAARDRMAGKKTTFSSYLMTHNTKVSIFTLALGMTFGIGTVIMLFYNGVILGAVIFDYIAAGELQFLLGWLLPHGAVEIPAILLAGQAGLVLGAALIGWGEHVPLSRRLRIISGDLTTLIFGVAVMLVWAGVIEAFFSQYHEPALPYTVKIAFGVTELILLVIFLARSGSWSTA